MQNANVNAAGQSLQLGSLLAAAMTSTPGAAATSNTLTTPLPRLVSVPTLEANSAAAVEFLCAVVGNGLIAVTQMVPDQPSCSGSTFELPRDRQPLQGWIEAGQGKANLYYVLNEPVPSQQQTGANGRVGKSDIARIRGIPVDIDPDRTVETASGGFERERERLLGLADRLTKQSTCRPTAIVDSGGGIQAIWLFPEPLPVSPDVQSAVEAQGRGLAKIFGGDAVQSVEHLFRIPFTLNLPDRKKRDRGRQRALSRCLHMAPESRAGLAALVELAPPVAALAPTSGTLDVSGAWSVLGTPENLEPELAARLAALRENAPRVGALLDSAQSAPDRSARDFAIAAACVEQGIVDPAEVADIVAAYSPGKFEQQGEAYLARTVLKACAQTKPRPSDPRKFFNVEDPDAQSAQLAAPTMTTGPLRWIDPTAWKGKAIPTREWEVPGLIPKNEVTLVYGDGGIGKTLLMHQYATCAATGQPWLGQATRKGRIMCFLCEDDEAELHRRQSDINRALGIDYTDLVDLRIISRKHDDNLMATWERGGHMKLTPVWTQLRDDAVAWKADVLIVDTIADIYGGSEIDRAQVTAFVKSCLGRLAQAIGGSVIALGHPSQSGQSSGEGTSGSSAWSNAARSRLFLRYPQPDSKKRETGKPTDVRELENKKLNYGPRGLRLKIRWVKGAFEAFATNSPGSIDAGARLTEVPRLEDAAENAVAAALLSAQSERLSLAPNSPFFAPKVLRQVDAEALDPFNASEVYEALIRLQRRGAIRKEEVGRDTSSRPIFGFAIVADKLSAEQSAPGDEPII
ncbi:AAA family ATPase [Methylobacterium sp. M6A4_1b]